MNAINMNATGAELYLGALPYGHSELEVKLGHKCYTVEVDRDMIDARVIIQMVGSITCRSDALLDREILENAAEIQKAQAVLYKYRRIL